jgi:hypothetical protein
MTAPAAFDYLYNLIQTAVASGPDSTIQVVDTQLLTHVANIYIELQGIENHHLEVRSLPLFAFNELYDIYGQVRVFRTDQNFEEARDEAWSYYEQYVRTAIIDDGNRLGNIVEWCIPFQANAVNEVTAQGGASTTISFSFTCHALVTNY